MMHGQLTITLTLTLTLMLTLTLLMTLTLSTSKAGEEIHLQAFRDSLPALPSV